MIKAMRVVELAWLAMAAYCLYNVFNVPSGTQQFYFMLAGIFVGIFMFWFRRRYRLRYQQKEQERENNDDKL